MGGVNAIAKVDTIPSDILSWRKFPKETSVSGRSKSASPIRELEPDFLQTAKVLACCLLIPPLAGTSPCVPGSWTKVPDDSQPHPVGGLRGTRAEAADCPPPCTAILDRGNMPIRRRRSTPRSGERSTNAAAYPSGLIGELTSW